MTEKKLDLPKRIKSIERDGKVEDKNGYRQISYILNRGTEEELFVETCFKDAKEYQESNQEIISAREEVINGLRLVKLKTGEYAYTTEKGELLPYRYAIASDFNEYGFAMVGKKDGNVTWINKKFQYLATNGKIVGFTDNSNTLPSYISTKKVSTFSKGEIPLGSITFESTTQILEGTSYIDAKGNIKEFAQYSGKNSTYNHKFTLFKEDLEFNPKGYVYQEKEKAILLATGYYITTASIIDIVMENIMIDNLFKEIKETPKQKSKNSKIN